MPRQIESRVFVQDQCLLGEGPFWHDQRLWWVDIESQHLHSVDAQGAHRVTYPFGQRITAATPIDDGRLLVALEKSLAIFDCRDQSIDTVTSLDGPPPAERFNDGKCDPSGRFLVGTLFMDGSAQRASLHSLEGTGALRTLVSGVTISNGLAWHRDGRTLYYIDSLSYEIVAYPYDPETGSLGEKTVVVRIAPEIGIPDGMSIDVKGNLWVALWGGSTVRCWSPLTGECLAVVNVPCTQPSSCCFGGPELDQLFITTARVEISEENLSTEPLAGSVFVCDPGTSGYPTNQFRL